MQLQSQSRQKIVMRETSSHMEVDVKVSYPVPTNQKYDDLHWSVGG